MTYKDIQPIVQRGWLPYGYHELREQGFTHVEDIGFFGFAMDLRSDSVRVFIRNPEEDIPPVRKNTRAYRRFQKWCENIPKVKLFTFSFEVISGHTRYQEEFRTVAWTYAEADEVFRAYIKAHWPEKIDFWSYTIEGEETQDYDL